MKLPFVGRKEYELVVYETEVNGRYINVLQARNDALRTECEGLIEQIENSSGKRK